MNAGARANLALVPAAGDAGTCAFTLSEANLIVDELGTLTSGTGYGWSLAAPRRAIDTRQCTATWCNGKPAAGGIVRVPLDTTSPAVAIAITVTEASAAGYVTVGPCDDIRAGAGERTSNVNFARNATVTGLAVVSVEDGEVCAYTRSPVQVIIDVQAELTTEQTVGVLPVTPTRCHDSRDAG